MAGRSDLLLGRFIRRHLGKIVKRDPQGLHYNSFLYKRGQKNVYALKASRQNIIDTFDVLEQKLGISLSPGSKLKLPNTINHFDSTVGDIIDWVQKRCNEEGVYISGNMEVRFKPATPSLKTEDKPSEKIVETVETPTEDTQDKMSWFRHATGIAFGNLSKPDKQGTIVSLVDAVGDAFFVASMQEKHLLSPLYMTNDVCYAALFDDSTLFESFSIEDGVLALNAEKELGSIIDKLVTHMTDLRHTCYVKLIPVSLAPSSVQTFEFGPTDHMTEIENRLTPELRSFLREKLNENRTSEDSTGTSSKKTDKG